ncbi:cell division protein ZapA [Erythrobacter litoralis]|uniref:Cell division protein ZapA n=1 Tax=Erythrobacter litoralis (strain HTCC2594) TaxID=314225 RepID=Q2NB10_ERYLH|nr:cell division protein ZapA [Erythrobacter litoralis]ABC63131.1 hypothetical protein ELI_05195 [Erythrobacter litoralis HTCC2594]
MNQIDITVGGRQFAIAVQPGDEEHVRNLADRINERFQQLANRYSQNLLFASLRIADELHAAEARRAKIEADSKTALTGIADLKREAELAEDKAAKLKERVSGLEKELDQAQTAIQQESNKYNDLIADNERFKVAVMEADSEKSRLQGELASLRSERDALEAKLAEAEEQSAPPQQASFINPAAAPDDPELAPSLERFAELLENCAAKLEGVGETS